AARYLRKRQASSPAPATTPASRQQFERDLPIESSALPREREPPRQYRANTSAPGVQRGRPMLRESSAMSQHGKLTPDRSKSEQKNHRTVMFNQPVMRYTAHPNRKKAGPTGETYFQNMPTFRADTEQMHRATSKVSCDVRTFSGRQRRQFHDRQDVNRERSD